MGGGPITFSMHFQGTSVLLSPGVLTARATAPSGALVTRIDTAGVRGDFEQVEGEEAHLECRLTFLDEERFEEVGTISFGNGNALRFRTIGPGTIERSATHGLRQGSATWVIDGGAGVFADSSGRVVSNFLLSDTGEITDHQVAVVFLGR